MSNFSYENQGTKTFLVYTVAPEDQIDSMSLGMLTNNRIPGLASTLYTQLDTTKFIKFDVSGKIALSQFFTGAVNRKRLLGVFNGIVNAMLNAEEYMIDAQTILLDHDHIFADVTTCETELICLPIDRAVQQPNLIDFFKQIMFSTQFDQTENCDHVARIINYLNSAPVFSLLEFQTVLKSIEQAEPAQPVVKSTPSRVQPPPAKTGQKTAQPQVQQVQKVQVQQVQQAQKVQQPQQQVQQSSKRQPPQQLTPEMTAVQPEVAVPDGPEISLYYLLQHYNKENAALYKAQKEARKAAEASGKAQKQKKEKPEKKGKEKKEKKDKKGKKESSAAQQVSYAVPGAPVNFAVPGQSAPVVTPAQQSASAQQQVQLPPQQQAINQQAQQASVVHTAPGNFGETVVLGGGGVGETTVLVANPPTETRAATPYLIRMSNNERIPVNKPVFRIGKERSYVDYFIGDNSAISRSHANIIQRGEQYFILDTNSKNHTYVDGRMIPSNAEFELVNGTRLRLANEDFEFQLL